MGWLLDECRSGQNIVRFGQADRGGLSLLEWVCERKAVTAAAKIAYVTDAGAYPIGRNARQFA
jgi:hypothetical protein